MNFKKKNGLIEDNLEKYGIFHSSINKDKLAEPGITTTKWVIIPE